MIRQTHPEYARRWDEFVERWAEKKGMPDAFCSWGLWRWKALPPKMRELCTAKGIAINPDFTLKAVKTPVVRQQIVHKPEVPTMEPAMKPVVVDRI